MNVSTIQGSGDMKRGNVGSEIELGLVEASKSIGESSKALCSGDEVNCGSCERRR